MQFLTLWFSQNKCFVSLIGPQQQEFIFKLTNWLKRALKFCGKNFTDERGITLIACGYLTENSILQGFPILSPDILQLCEEILIRNPCFLEGLLWSYALRDFKRGKCSEENSKTENQVILCIMNLISFVHKAEPNSSPCEDPFEFDKNYSSWLHVLYYHLAERNQGLNTQSHSNLCFP